MTAIDTAMAQPKRSESEILLKELKLTLGEKEYVVPVLRSRAAAKWREEDFGITKEVSDANPAKFEQDDDPKKIAEAVSRGLMGALLRYPAKIPELIFSYAPSLKEHEAEIMESAFDQEFERAYAQIWQVAFRPFLASLGMVLEMQRSQDTLLRSSAATN